MTLKKILAILGLFHFLALHSQEQVSSLPSNSKKAKEIFTVINEVDRQTALFFVDKTSLSATRFNENFESIDSLSIQFEKKQVANIMGYSRTKNQYYIYREGSNSDEIAVQHFDFEAKKTVSKTIVFDLAKEKIINQFTSKSIFYVVTVVKNSSILNFYHFQDGVMDKNVVDCSRMIFLDHQQQRVNLWGLYKDKSMIYYHDSIENISDETPASLVLCANKNKAYIFNEKIVYTFDSNKNSTQALTINFSDYKASQKMYGMSSISTVVGESSESNSLLINNVLIQMKVRDNLLQMTVKDLNNNLLKSFELYAGHEMGFKNSDIIEENGSIESSKTLGSSNQLIRKIKNLFASVSGTYIDGMYYLTLGGVSPPQQNGAVLAGGMLGGLSGALIASAIASNYSAGNLESYQNKKIVYVQTILDSNFNHVQGQYRKRAFDKLRVFVEKNEQLTNHTIFKFNEKLYLLAFNKNNKAYSVYRFEEPILE